MAEAFCRLSDVNTYNMNQSEGKQIIEQLTADFLSNQENYLSEKFNETETRNRFIDPFFKALGWQFDQTGVSPDLWDVRREYLHKEGSVNKRPDYEFRTGGRLRFFVEAKSPHIRIDAKDPVHQAKRYAFSTSGKAPIVILTNFYNFKVFNALERPIYKNPLRGLLKEFDLSYEQYSEKWELLYSHFSKEAVSAGSLDRLAQKISRHSKKMDEEFLSDIAGWREKLAESIAILNPDLNADDLNESVQRVLDRMIFLRNLEDRNLEAENTLLKIALNAGEAYPKLVKIFNGLNEFYNGLLFKPHFSEHLIFDDNLVRTVISEMCYPESPFQFDVIEPEILGHIYEWFLGSKIRLTDKNKAVVEEKPEVRKAGGVYYTPQYIVDYIVRNTVGEKIEGLSPEEIEKIKILDPACGSGSFLLGAFDYLIRYHEQWYDKHRKSRIYRQDFYLTPDAKVKLSIAKKAGLLKNNIFGTDIDREATEVAMMSLYLKLMKNGIGKSQMELMHGHVMPDLSCNIKCGNALIGHDFYDGQISLNFEERKRVNAFEWKKEFPEILASGGFDCIIGNPPYIRIQAMKEWAPVEVEFYKKHYMSAKKGNYDIYVVFVEKGLNLLSKNGVLGFILPHKFFNSQYGEPLRGIVSSGKHLSQVVHFGAQQVFSGSTNYTCLLFLDKAGIEQCRFVKVDNIAEWQISKGVIPSSNIGRAEWNFIIGKDAALFERLSAMPVKLGDMADIFVGLQTSADDVFIMDLIEETDDYLRLKSESLNSVRIFEKELFFPLLSGTDVNRYRQLPERQYILFPYNIDDASVNLIDFGVISNLYPKTAAYLLKNKKRLSGRERGKAKGLRWYGYIYLKNMARQSVEKLCVPRLVDRLYAAYDESGSHFLDNVDVGGITLKPAYQKQGLIYLLGLLNSKLLRWYFPYVSAPFRGGWLSANRQFLSRLPIRTINFNDPKDKARHAQMLKLVEQMLDLHKRLAAAKSLRDINLFSREIDATDDQIDRLVYALYDLTEEEIRIVESSET